MGTGAWVEENHPRDERGRAPRFHQTFAAYMGGFKGALKEKDPVGYKMVQDVLKLRGISDP